MAGRGEIASDGPDVVTRDRLAGALARLEAPMGQTGVTDDIAPLVRGATEVKRWELGAAIIENRETQ